MDRAMPGLMFNGMSFLFKIRDLLSPPGETLREVDICPGFQVLDYGCGPGAYIPDVAEKVDQLGRVYALDIHPLAIERVKTLARRRQLTNVETICSDCQTGLQGDILDVVLLYDIFHMLSEPDAVLAELHRVLKPGGTLSFSDPHMQEADILDGVTRSGLFKLARRNHKTYSFAPT